MADCQSRFARAVRRARQLRTQARPYARGANRMRARSARCLWTDHQRSPCASSARIPGWPDAIVECTVIMTRPPGVYHAAKGGAEEARTMKQAWKVSRSGGFRCSLLLVAMLVACPTQA